MGQRIACAVLTALLIGTVGTPAYGQENDAPPEYIPYVAVTPLEGHGIAESEAATLTEVLSNELLNTGKFRVMERDRMNEILQEQGFQQSGACNDEACLVEMGQMLGIEQLIAGSIGKVGKAYSINVRIVSVATGEILRNVSHNYTGPIEDLLTHEMGVVAKKLAGKDPSVEPRTDTRNLRPVVIGGVAGAAALVGGGAAVFWFLRQRAGNGGEEETAELEVAW